MRDMRLKIQHIVLLVILLLPISAQAQVGKQFWFASPEMATHSRDMSLRVYIFAETDNETDITLSLPADSLFIPLSVHLNGHSYQEVVIAPNYQDYMTRFAAYHNKINNTGILIAANNLISAYVQMTGINGETYTLKGENALGNDFMAAIQNQYRNSNTNSKQGVYKNAYSSVQIVATEDNTTVTIEPSQVLYGDTTITNRTVVLHRGQVYSIRAKSKQPLAHITATHITSDKPIVVLTMDDSMSPYQKYFGEDAAAEQMVPSSLLGTDYIAIGRGLKWEGVCITDLQTGKTEFRSMNGQPTMVIHSDHPVQVFQITGHRNEAGGTQLPELNHSGSKVVHYKRMIDSRWAWIHLLTKTNNIDSLYINDSPISSTLFHPVQDDPEWSYAIIDITAYPMDELIDVTSSGGLFLMAVTDASSAIKAADGHDVPTSCSYGYFSSYSMPVVPQDTDTIPIVEEPIIEPIDTLPVIDTVPPVDSVVHSPHRILLYGEGAYSHIPFGNRDFQWGLGYGAGAGIMYEYQHKHFILNVGVGFLWQDVEHKRKVDISGPWTDSRGTDVILMSHVQRSDRSRMGYVEIPVLVGGSWDWFYCLGGVKVGFPVFGNTQCTARVSDYGIYDKYFVPLSEMPNHGYRNDVPVEKKDSRLDYVVDTRLTFELGVNLGRAHVSQPIQPTDSLITLPEENPNTNQPDKVTYRLGFYVDYGLLEPRQKSDAVWMDTNDDVRFERWQLNHPLRSTYGNNAWTQNFFVGIKLTIGFTCMPKQ